MYEAKRKRYVKPCCLAIQTEIEPMMAGSITGTGNQTGQGGSAAKEDDLSGIDDFDGWDGAAYSPEATTGSSNEMFDY